MKKTFFLIFLFFFLQTLRAENYLVIIGGNITEKSTKTEHYDATKSGFFDEFWNDPVLFFKNAIANGIPRENITVLWGDGKQWGARQGYSPRYRINNFVDMAATAENLKLVTDELSRKINPNDVLFVYVFSHGKRIGKEESALVLYNSLIKSSEFAKLFDKISYRYRVFFMQQCYSGGFINDLSNEKTVIMTATTSKNVAWRADNVLKPPLTDYEIPDTIYGLENEITFYGLKTYHHGEWSFHLLTALSGGYSLYYNNEVYQDSIDNDRNGKISLEEANCWIIKRDSRDESPQISDLGDLANKIYIWPLIEIASSKPKKFIDVENIGSNKIYLHSKLQINFSISVYDVLGRKVKEIQMNRFAYLFFQKSGIYFLVIRLDGRIYQKEKVVIIKK